MSLLQGAVLDDDVRVQNDRDGSDTVPSAPPTFGTIPRTGRSYQTATGIPAAGGPEGAEISASTQSSPAPTAESLSVNGVENLGELTRTGVAATSPGALVVVDGHGIIRLANDGAADRLGCSREDLLGQNVAKVLVPLEELAARSGDGQQFARIVRPDGVQMQVHITYSVSDLRKAGRDQQDQELCAIAFLEETQGRAVTDRLRRLACIGAAAPATIDSVKSSLAVIAASLERLSEGACKAEVRSHTETLLAEIRRGVVALDGFSVIGDNLRTKQFVDLGPMLDDARQGVAQYTKQRDVQLQWVVAAMPPLPLDPAVVHAILLSLANRAIRACDPGDVVRVEASIQTHDLVLTVSDTGSRSIPEAAHDGSELSFSEWSRGHGVDLESFVPAIEDAGGALEVGTNKEGGTMLTMRVPVHLTGAKPR